MRGNRLTRKFVRRLTAAFATLLAWAASAPAQTVVVGTGNPDLDVPAVQAAVDQGGEVTLKGHFSFHRPSVVLAKSDATENAFAETDLALFLHCEFELSLSLSSLLGRGCRNALAACI